MKRVKNGTTLFLEIFTAVIAAFLCITILMMMFLMFSFTVNTSSITWHDEITGEDVISSNVVLTTKNPISATIKKGNAFLIRTENAIVNIQGKNKEETQKMYSITADNEDLFVKVIPAQNNAAKIETWFNGPIKDLDKALIAFGLPALLVNATTILMGFLFVFIYIAFRKTKIISIRIALLGVLLSTSYILFTINNNPFYYNLLEKFMLQNIDFKTPMFAVASTTVSLIVFSYLSNKNPIKYILTGMNIINLIISFTNSDLSIQYFSPILIIVGVYAIALTIIIKKNSGKKKCLIVSTILINIVFIPIAIYELSSTETAFYLENGKAVFAVGLVIMWIIIAVKVIKDINITSIKDEKYETERKDNLTGLMNKRYLDELISQKEELKSETDTCVIQFDINDIKKINAVFGHEDGDKMITEVAEAIKTSFNDSATKIRQGSDEFIVIIDSPNAETEAMQGVESFNQNIIFKNSTRAEEQKIHVAYGMAIGKDKDIKKLIESAYENMLKSKKRMKGNDYIENEEAYKIIKHAILHNSVEPYFQPIRDNNTGTFNKFESLMRINYNSKAYPPGIFMDYIKHSSQYFLISAQMLQKASDAFQDIEATISLNISSRDIANDTIRTLITDNLKRPHKNNFILELLETEEFADEIVLMEFLMQAKKLGALIAIDDFGSGYSNLKLIAEVKPNFIKIDGTIIKNIEKDEIMKTMANSIVKIADSIGAEVVAEFVENSQIQKIIEDIGIRYSQGYHYSKPLPFEEAKAYIM